MNNASEKIKKYLEKLPQSPGVYIFRDAQNNILYIGKATNLKSRVRSYFNGNSDFLRPIERALGKVEKIEIQKTDSVLEALILESNLIKKLQPKYNVDLKDDKSFAYAAITKEVFPRIIILRKTDIDFEKLEAKSQKLKDVYGPYTSKKQLETALKIIRKIFPYHSLKQKTEKGCLDFQIGNCPGPYAGNISKEDYKKNIRNIRMILEGKKKNLIKRIEKEMKEYAEKHEFEKAGDLRNKVFALQHIQDVALLAGEKSIQNTKYNIRDTRIEAYDISNISGTNAVGSMVVFKNNEPDKSQYRKFKIKTVEGSDDVGMMREILTRRFQNDWPKPDLILLDGGIGHFNMGVSVVKSLGLNVPIVAVAKGPTRKNLELRISNLEWESRIKNIVENKSLIKQIMDEAHRFAITYHKKVRKKNFV